MAVAGLAGAIGLRALTDNIIEAEKATAQLDAAFKATGRTLGLTRSQLDDIASSMQRMTTVSDDLVKEAQAIVLSFDRVRGQAFERTIKASADLSARFGTDLVSNARALGRALQDPERGLQALTRIGITFTESQRETVKTLIDSGRAFEAQNLILAEVERRFRGSAEAARNTLGGALIGLKNNFGDLFEGSSASTSGFVSAINKLTETISSEDFKQGFDLMLTSLGKFVDLLGTLVSLLGRATSATKEFAQESRVGGGLITSFLTTLPGGRGLADILLQSGADNNQRRRGGRPAGSFQSGHSAIGADEAELLSAVSEIKIDLRKKELNADEQYFEQLNALSRTSTEQQVARYHEIVEAARALRNEGVITQKQFQARSDEALDDLLPEFDLDKIRSLYKEVKTMTSEVTAFVRGAWERAGASIQQTLSNAFYEGKLSARSLLDVVRRTVSDILAALVTSGIKKAFVNLFTTSGGDSSAAFGTSFLSALGFAAGGGQINRPTWVGENGMELAVPGAGGARIYNKAQLAGMGMGGTTVTYAPSFAISIVAKDAEETEARLAQYLELRLAQNNKELVRELGRNGVEVR